MFCPNCGNRVNDDASFCVKCGCKLNPSGIKNNETNRLRITPTIGWVSLTICFLMLIVSLSIAISYDKIEGSLDLIIPIIFSLIALGTSAFILSNSKKEKNTSTQFKSLYVVAIIVVMLSALLAFEVCLGPFIGELTKNK